MDACTVLFVVGMPDLQNARDRQDKAALDKMIADLRVIAEKQPNDANALYRLAVAESYLPLKLRSKRTTKPTAGNWRKRA